MKSSNILLDSTYKVKITDFGNSKFKKKMSHENEMTRVGTVHWMAPEVLREEE